MILLRRCVCVVKAKFHYAAQLANQLVRELVCDLLVSCYSELDSVMEFGLSGAILLASSSLAGRRPVRELVTTYQLQTGLLPDSSYLDMSRQL